MNKRIREIIFITSLSFTLVIMINAVLEIYYEATTLSSFDIISVFATCISIAVLISFGDLIPIIRNHPLIYNYAIVMIVASGLDYLIYGHFYWSNFIFQTIMLTVVFIGVWLGAYGIHYKEAELINKKLNEVHKRN